MPRGRPLRPLGPVLATIAILLGNGSSTLAAASPSSASLDMNWCFQDGSTECGSDVDGTVRCLDTTVGSSVTINEMTRTTAYGAGEYEGTWTCGA